MNYFKVRGDFARVSRSRGCYRSALPLLAPELRVATSGLAVGGAIRLEAF